MQYFGIEYDVPYFSIWIMHAKFHPLIKKAVEYSRLEVGLVTIKRAIMRIQIFPPILSFSKASLKTKTEFEVLNIWFNVKMSYSERYQGTRDKAIQKIESGFK